jgi:hypothetical protein
VRGPLRRARARRPPPSARFFLTRPLPFTQHVTAAAATASTAAATTACPPSSPPTTTCSTAAQFKGTVQPIARGAGALAYGSLADAKKAVPGGIVSEAGKPLYTSAFETLRKERANARLVGIREKKAKEAAAKDAAAAKKAGKAGDAADE